MDLMYSISVAIAIALALTLFIFGLVYGADALAKKFPKVGANLELTPMTAFIVTFVTLSVTMTYAYLELGKYVVQHDYEKVEVEYLKDLAVE